MKKIITTQSVICTVLLLCSSAMQAQLPATAEGLEQSRLVTRATMYGVGLTNVFDTYLSPQEYTGIDFRVSRESMRMTRWMDGRLSLQSFFQADLGLSLIHIYFSPGTTDVISPDDDGFIRRWLLLEPIDKPNRSNTVFRCV